MLLVPENLLQTKGSGEKGRRHPFPNTDFRGWNYNFVVWPPVLAGNVLWKARFGVPRGIVDAIQRTSNDDIGASICHMGVGPVDTHDHRKEGPVVPALGSLNHSAGSKATFDECREEVLAILDVLRAERFHRYLLLRATCLIVATVAAVRALAVLRRVGLASLLIVVCANRVVVAAVLGAVRFDSLLPCWATRLVVAAFAAV